ncbi:MAG TPA: ribonuclease HI [Thermoplasmata archaeon]|nr:ribonuclease HI [Thermoplasmata archaeon]
MRDHEIPRGIAAFGAEAPVVVHFDGACQPPRGGGLAAYGFTIEGVGLAFQDHGLAVRPYAEHSTNNVAEYVGAIRALEWLLEHGHDGEVLVRGDSELVIRQMNGAYEVRAEHLRAYHERLRQLAGRFRKVVFEWVPREENAEADALSKQALEEHRTGARAYRPNGRPTAGSGSDAEPDPDRA